MKSIFVSLKSKALIEVHYNLHYIYIYFFLINFIFIVHIHNSYITSLMFGYI